METQARKALYTVGEEIAHALTHGLGLVLSIAGAALLVAAASLRGDAWHVVGCAVFGTTLVLLYAASTLYHGAPIGRAKRLLQRLDHAAIFLLIAGTYTPFTLVSLRDGWGFALFALVWGIALVGVALVAAIPQHMRRLSVALYLAMGWMVVIVLEPLARSVGTDGLSTPGSACPTTTRSGTSSCWPAAPVTSPACCATSSPPAEGNRDVG
jgi:hemolysin III